MESLAQITLAASRFQAMLGENPAQDEKDHKKQLSAWRHKPRLAQRPVGDHRDILVCKITGT
tara:strand:+ start:973 stop:1158 length:186 start_codon:yes stop_codon:yes gene_type:complete